MRDLYAATDTFRLFSPDETASNRLQAVFEVTDRAFMGPVLATDDHLGPDGRVMEVLSEHLCQGWLEGYTLTGRHGVFATYEAFAMVSVSMAVQHVKWLQHAQELPWRASVPSLNVLLTSTCWRNDHNGFSHQGPGLIDSMLPLSPGVVRVWLPPDANTTLSIMDHCLRSTDHVNLIVVDKQPHLQYLTLAEAHQHNAAGAGIWEWALVVSRGGAAGHRAGVRGRRTDPGGAGRRRAAARARAGASGSLRERGGPDGPAAGGRPPARLHRQPVQRDLHRRPGCGVRLPRVPAGRAPGDPRPLATRAASTSAGSASRAPRPPPSTWWCSTGCRRFHLVQEVLRRAGRRVDGWDRLQRLCEERLAEHATYIVEHLEDMPDVAEWTWRG